VEGPGGDDLKVAQRRPRIWPAGGLFPRSASPYTAASSTFRADELAPEGSAGGMGQPRAPEGRPRAQAPPRASSAAGELLLTCALPREAPPRAVWAATGGCG
jgi:hypothetical protein